MLPIGLVSDECTCNQIIAADLKTICLHYPVNMRLTWDDLKVYPVFCNQDKLPSPYNHCIFHLTKQPLLSALKLPRLVFHFLFHPNIPVHEAHNIRSTTPND